MDEQPEVILQQMEETRSNLADKLEALENQVSDTVQATTSAVTETVETVKETVENVTETVKETVEKATETVESVGHAVGEAFDISVQTERHPWIVFGGSLALGFTVAQLLGSSKKKADQEASDRAWQSRLPALESTSSKDYGHRPAEPPPSAQTAAEPEEGKKSWLWEQVDRLKGLAIGSLMGVVRDMAAKNLPGSLGQRVAEEVDSLTTNLGGEPIHGSLFGNNNKGSDSSQSL